MAARTFSCPVATRCCWASSGRPLRLRGGRPDSFSLPGDSCELLKEGPRQPMDHISTAVVKSFLACLLPREQNLLVVRHLLAQCPICLQQIQLVLYPAKPTGRESSFRRPGESRAVYSLAIERFFQSLEDELVELFDV
jgi:hypothetical protein